MSMTACWLHALLNRVMQNVLYSQKAHLVRQPTCWLYVAMNKWVCVSCSVLAFVQSCVTQYRLSE